MVLLFGSYAMYFMFSLTANKMNETVFFFLLAFFIFILSLVKSIFYTFIKRDWKHIKNKQNDKHFQSSHHMRFVVILLSYHLISHFLYLWLFDNEFLWDRWKCTSITDFNCISFSFFSFFIFIMWKWKMSENELNYKVYF